jgi:5-methylcytosine-specific restriction endonuclease McrBC GTP-binding regulatory subunit McrB
MANAVHEKVLNFLEGYRATHSDFVYWLRERNTKNRLDDGFWFQGNEEYVFVGLYDHSGGSNKTRSIGLYFFPAPNNSVTCSVEVVYNEEQDKLVLLLYEEIKKLIGNFRRIADTRYRKDFPGDGFETATNFLNNIKPSIDALIRKLKLDDFLIQKSDFEEKLQNINARRNKNVMKLFPPEKADELKRRYQAFKLDDFFKTRIRQLEFVPFAKRIISESLKNTPTNEIFTGLIQILKNGATGETVNRYINQNISSLNLRSELKREFAGFGFTGYTGAGKAGINGLSSQQLETVKIFILDCSAIKTKEEAIKRVKEFDDLKIPQVKSGVYSPWLYYTNPEIFPIKNDSHDEFIEWCNQSTDSYPLAIDLFHEVAEILSETDLGLIDAFTHMFTNEAVIDVSDNTNEISTMSLNTILYGPPGTGKTYHTVDKAIAIANPDFNLNDKSRNELKEEFERLTKEGQIEFITFHQSLSYEDFIEGIKPVEPKEDDEYLKYEIKDGLFKRLAERASKVPETKPTGFSIPEDEFQKAGFYKLSLGDTSNSDDDQIYEWCVKNGYIALGWGSANDFTGLNENQIQQMVPAILEKFAARAVNYFVHYLKVGDFVVITYGNLQFRAIGKVTGNYEYKNVEGLRTHHFRKVDWLLKDEELPYEELYNKQFSQQTIYKLDKREIKRDFFVKASTARIVNNKRKNYVLIIDEINRGNVSQIFGELITLVEEDKRQGQIEALTITLPYSKKPFSVPLNLYIVGTMNTADRSVEALDTALRRRFAFDPIMPDEKLLSPQRMVWKLWWDYPELLWQQEPYKTKEQKLYSLLGVEPGFGHDDKLWSRIKGKKNEAQIAEFNSMPLNGNGLNLQIMLKTINERLTALLTRDHTIGHAWLMDVNSLESLQSAFKNKILPLLQEFFYNDYAKIGLVLGNAFVTEKQVHKELFAKFKDTNELAADYEEKIVYTLSDPFILTVADFQSIYP